MTLVRGIGGRNEAPIANTQAVLFDCDGVIVVSEELHRLSYNQVFEEYDTNTLWSEEYYDILQNSVGGGKGKMRYHFRQNGWPASKLGPPPKTREEQEELIDALQERKTEVFEASISAGNAIPRPGILELIDLVLERRDLKAAVCSAATKSSAQKVLLAILGSERLAKFDLLLLGDDVDKKKPDPMIYDLAAERLGVAPSNCVVIEDSKIGLDAAQRAGMPCYITHTDSTKGQDFTGAIAVVADATQLSLVEILSQ